MPTIFVIVSDPAKVHAEIGQRIARRFSLDPDCQAMPNVWAIRTNAPPDDVLAFVQAEGLADASAQIVVTRVAGVWAALNAKREPDCWQGGDWLRMSGASGYGARVPETADR